MVVQLTALFVCMQMSLALRNVAHGNFDNKANNLGSTCNPNANSLI
jgi:hypothetical protein